MALPLAPDCAGAPGRRRGPGNWATPTWREAWRPARWTSTGRPTGPDGEVAPQPRGGCLPPNRREAFTADALPTTTSGSARMPAPTSCCFWCSVRSERQRHLYQQTAHLGANRKTPISHGISLKSAVERLCLLSLLLGFAAAVSPGCGDVPRQWLGPSGAILPRRPSRRRAGVRGPARRAPPATRPRRPAPRSRWREHPAPRPAEHGKRIDK